MKIKQFEIWIANLSPRNGTEAGKKRPVITVQTNLLNDVGHSSTIICPLTTNVQKRADLLRVNLKKGSFGLEKDSDVMIDQIRAIDNNRLLNKIGVLSESKIKKIKENLKIILDLDYDYEILIPELK